MARGCRRGHGGDTREMSGKAARASAWKRSGRRRNLGCAEAAPRTKNYFPRYENCVSRVRTEIRGRARFRSKDAESPYLGNATLVPGKIIFPPRTRERNGTDPPTLSFGAADALRAHAPRPASARVGHGKQKREAAARLGGGRARRRGPRRGRTAAALRGGLGRPRRRSDLPAPMRRGVRSRRRRRRGAASRLLRGGQGRHGLVRGNGARRGPARPGELRGLRPRHRRPRRGMGVRIQPDPRGIRLQRRRHLRRAARRSVRGGQVRGALPRDARLRPRAGTRGARGSRARPRRSARMVRRNLRSNRGQPRSGT